MRSKPSSQASRQLEDRGPERPGKRGNKAALFEASFADGLARLSERVRVPVPDSLDALSFWPSVYTLVDDLREAGGYGDLPAISRLFHMPDAPENTACSDFERPVRRWCGRMVRTGRKLE